MCETLRIQQVVLRVKHDLWVFYDANKGIPSTGEILFRNPETFHLAQLLDLPEFEFGSEPSKDLEPIVVSDSGVVYTSFGIFEKLYLVFLRDHYLQDLDWSKK